MARMTPAHSARLACASLLGLAAVACQSRDPARSAPDAATIPSPALCSHVAGAERSLQEAMRRVDGIRHGWAEAPLPARAVTVTLGEMP